MKYIKAFILALIITMFFNTAHAYAQESKYIEVTGSAEMSIQPDEVEISIVLQDSRANFEKREDEFIDICKKYKISEDQLAFKNANSEWGWNYWWYWWYYRSSSELMQTYKIKVNIKTNLLDLVKELNKPWVRNISIGTTSNKDLQVYRKEVKKEAVRMAKEKATYLLEAIDETIGSVISIEEVIADNGNSKNGQRYWNGYGWYWDNPYYGNSLNSSNSNSNMNSNSVMNSGNSSNGNSSGENDLAGLSKIKLRYEVKAKFSIK